MSGGWATSNRAQRLPANWPQLRAAARRRAHNQCQAERHEPDCPGTGTECDHIIAGDDHSQHNLQWLSATCHAAKTRREAAAARPRERRTREQHPGLAVRPPRG